jgi:hypothetical protein
MIDVHRRITHRLPALWIAAVLALACCGTAFAATSSSSSHAASTVTLGGTWKGHYGGAVSGHFTIHWKKTGSLLHGTITLSNPQGKYDINGKVLRGGQIKFGAVSVGAKYKGQVRGTSMSGTWTSPQGGGSWSATKTS